MNISTITLFTSLLIAAIAAWFSIVGLIAIFTGAAISIAIMAITLELGKLVTASWLYRNWNDTPVLLKSYLTIAVIILMFITSMGIFGFLSKAHIEQNASTGNNEAKSNRYAERIAYERKNITDAETVLSQLDSAVVTLTRYDKISGPTGAIAIRKTQKPERQELRKTIEDSQKEIDSIEDKKFVLDSELRDLEREVGPVRYIAELIYDDAETKLDSAVRVVIIALIFVFDPLAVLLLIAANQSLVNKPPQNSKTKEPEQKVTQEVTQEVTTQKKPKWVNTKRS